MKPRTRRDPHAIGAARRLAIPARDRALTEAAVRREIRRLGARHRGEPLRGALDELKLPDLAADRAGLLRACVRRLRAN